MNRKYIQQISTKTRPAILLGLLLLSAGTVWAQISFRDLDLTTLRHPSPGYYLISPNAMDSLSFMDNSGKNVFKTFVGPHANVQAYNGRFVTHYVGGGSGGETKAGFVRRNVSLAAIDTMRPAAPYTTDFHEGKMWTDSTYIILANSSVPMDMSAVVAGGSPNASIFNCIIQERTFDGRTKFTWNALDYIPVTDATEDVNLRDLFIDYIHINSIWKDTDDNLIVSCRHLDEVIKINRNTGAIMWRLGGTKSKGNQFTFLNDTTAGFVGFSHQHSVARTSKGTLLMFDNGNLKGVPRKSRAVEYEIDAVAMTAKRVWQFYPTPDVYSSTMGSAQELENGSILIGYGSGSDVLVANEVRRDGTIDVEIRNNNGGGFVSYRVHKEVIAMTGAFRTITAPATTMFTRGDSNTYVSVTWTRVDDTTTAVMERHMYEPHNITFEDVAYCGIMPTRWTFRIKDTNRVAGIMSFDFGKIPGVVFPDQLRVFHRPKEGTGAFRFVDGLYSESTKRFTINQVFVGEFLVAYQKCLNPQPVTPLNLATEVNAAPQMVWSEAVTTNGYEVQLSLNPAFAPVLRTFSTRKVDTTIAALTEHTLVYWRVRTKLPAGFGPWSEVFRFTTQMGIPTVVAPRLVVVKDTVAILPTQIFEWTRPTGVTRFRVQITALGAPIAMIDTTLDGLSFVPGAKLSPAFKYTWNVRGVVGTAEGRPSTTAFFVTAPLAPRLISPATDASDVTTQNTPFLWSPEFGAVRYQVRVLLVADSTVVFSDTSSKTSLSAPTLPPGKILFWTCRSFGPYGPGAWAPFSQFRTNSSVTLAAPATIAPKKVGGVDTLDVNFSWTGVKDASAYHLQITTKSGFGGPDIERLGLTGSNWTAPVLQAGKTYRWRVLGYSDVAGGRWSDTASFTTKASPSQGLIPLTPVTGSVDVPLSGVFTYTTESKYSVYEVQLSKSDAFDTLTHLFQSTTGTCPYSNLVGGTTYHWRALGKRTGAESDTGSSATLSTIITSSVDGDLASACKGVKARWVGNDVVADLYCVPLTQYIARLYALDGTLVASAVGLAESSRIVLSTPSVAIGTYFLSISLSGGVQLTSPVAR